MAIQPTPKEQRMADTHSVLLLADSIQRMRELVKDEELNILMQGREYMKLAERMAEMSRLANICSGVYFTLFIAKNGEPPVKLPNNPNIQIGTPALPNNVVPMMPNIGESNEPKSSV
jgi:hypothetical protein